MITCVRRGPPRRRAELAAVPSVLLALALAVTSGCTEDAPGDGGADGAGAGGAGGSAGGGGEGGGGGGAGQGGSGGTCGPESCNGVDDDCDGVPDNGLGELHCTGALCDFTRAACVDGRRATCAFSAFENCTDGIDDDCDAFTDCEDSDCLDMWRVEAGEYYGADGVRTSSGFAVVAARRGGEDISDTMLWLIDPERRWSVTSKLDEGAGTTWAADWVRPRILKAPDGFVVAATRYPNTEQPSVRLLTVDEQGRTRSAETLPSPPTEGVVLKAAFPSSDGAGLVLLVVGAPLDGSFPTGRYFIGYFRWDGTRRTEWMEVPHTSTVFFPRLAADGAGDILVWGQVRGANFDLFLSELSPEAGAGPPIRVGVTPRSTTDGLIDVAGLPGMGFVLAFEDAEPFVPENGVTLAVFDRTGTVISKGQPFGQPGSALRFLRVNEILWLFMAGQANRTLFAPIASDGSPAEAARLTRYATPQGILGAATTVSSPLTVVFGQGAVFGPGQGTVFAVLDNVCLESF